MAEHKHAFHHFILPLMGGSIAGTTVDVVLYPLDTIKTRFQSKKGFRSAGGFRNVYAGILPAVAGSAPSAATFFCTYELVKYAGNRFYGRPSPMIHMLAASMGEVMSCLVRVPFEVIKQRAQANRNMRPIQILTNTLRTEGPLGLYRGYLTTIFREIPFSFIQYPIWEYLKYKWSLVQRQSVLPWQGAVCGAVAGGIAAACTTPLDVAKTRVMLAQRKSEEVSLSVYKLLITIGRQEGLRGLFAGFVPRVTWISIGGFIFLGAYEKSTHTISQWYLLNQ